MSDIKKQYEALFDKLNNMQDNESSHILQDRIYRKFIKDICAGKISSRDIKKIAHEMNEHVVKKDKNRWYA